MWKFVNILKIEHCWKLRCKRLCVQWYRFRFQTIDSTKQSFSKIKKSNMSIIVKCFENVWNSKIVWNLNCKLSCVEWYWFVVSSNYSDVNIFFNNWKNRFVKHVKISLTYRTFQNRLKSEMNAFLFRMIVISGLKKILM